jgi:hypothetical protein
MGADYQSENPLSPKLTRHSPMTLYIAVIVESALVTQTVPPVMSAVRGIPVEIVMPRFVGDKQLRLPFDGCFQINSTVAGTRICAIDPKLTSA